ncbi:MAG: EAL domain-containing protein [Proteobacteria bacterium]|nr:MAG: EAL domain-containing protein [Pseudomonadota bacterium]QKK10313.1 MAG: EAL domain-containing protein [Pseudomonadota bacterium]
MKKEVTSILVVDDQQKALDSLELILVQHGYQITTVNNGKQALELLDRQQFDMALLDMRMPGIGGAEIMAGITARELDTAVIVVSGDATFDAAASALRQGAYDFIRKPYAIEQLLRSVSNALKERQLKRENERIHERLRHSERLHRYMVNSSPDIIYILDDKGRFVFLNNKVEELLGYKRQDLLGRHYSEIIHPDDISLARFAFHERRTGERATNNFEIRVRRKDENSGSGYFEVTAVSVELSSMGIYRALDKGSDKEYLGTYGVARDVTERKEAERLISYQAYHDLLTGLPNRSLLADHFELAVAQARRTDGQAALMFIDLNRFKVVNDTLGHAVGDDLLRAVAARFRECVRAGDTLARIGGDEFVLLLPQVIDREEIESVASKLIAQLRESIDLTAEEVFVSASVGITLFPDDGDELGQLMRKADIAMYAAKACTSGGYEFFDASMDEALAGHLSLDSGLRRAVDEDQFIVHYQPQYCARSGHIVGAEALIRWQHPLRGLLPPDEFIPHAEDTGLIVRVGEWVANHACRTLAGWRCVGRDNFRLSINVSAPELEQENFVDNLLECLARCNLPGQSLEVEITENTLARNLESVSIKLRRLAANGVSIAIDDFGTGYSSLSYLHKLPINTLKIDRSFVNVLSGDPRTRAIIRGITNIAEGLGVRVIAEGVENTRQRDLLLELGCETMQGFLFSRPVNDRVLDDLLLRGASTGLPGLRVDLKGV